MEERSVKERRREVGGRVEGETWEGERRERGGRNREKGDERKRRERGVNSQRQEVGSKKGKLETLVVTFMNEG